MFQFLVALSTTESEYIVVAKAVKEVLWLTGLVKELGVEQVELSCIVIVKVSFTYQRTKCIIQ
jgi:hypothetical protein